MKQFEDLLKEIETPGSMARKLFFALVFFVLGLLLVYLGFWRTLLIAGFTAFGIFLGASASITEAFKSLVNKLFPPANKAVIYSNEDIEKVQKALEKKEKAKAKE
jgi:uncharacterized membrane protein